MGRREQEEQRKREEKAAWQVADAAKRATWHAYLRGTLDAVSPQLQPDTGPVLVPVVHQAPVVALRNEQQVDEVQPGSPVSTERPRPGRSARRSCWRARPGKRRGHRSRRQLASGRPVLRLLSVWWYK